MTDSEKILKVLTKFYPEDFIDVQEDGESKLFFYPIGSILYDNGQYMFANDYSFMDGHVDTRINCMIVKEIIDSDIDLLVIEGYWTVMDEVSSTIIEAIWEHDVFEFMNSKDIEFGEALDLLISTVKEKPKSQLN